MSVLSNSNAIATTGGAYNITDSLRLRESASAYLSRTPTTTGDRQKFTVSAWVKFSKLNSSIILNSIASTGNRVVFRFSGTNGQFHVIISEGGINYGCLSNNYMRDPSAWYHLVLALDTTQATSLNRIKGWINGEEITSWSSHNPPAQNYNMHINYSSAEMAIGADSNVSNYLSDAYYAEYNYVDGQALDASYFGETNADGVWSPKEYTGTYGTNGFYLPMKETTQATGFNTVTWTGNATTTDITGVGFSPDLVWIKGRNTTYSHTLYDTVRGATNYLASDTTGTEVSASGSLTSFNDDGFSLGVDAYVNGNGANQVAWCWDAGTTSFNSSAGLFSSGNYLTFANNSAFEVGSDWTLDVYLKPTATGSSRAFYSYLSAGSGLYGLIMQLTSSNNVQLIGYNNGDSNFDGLITFGGTVDTNKWTRVTIVRSSGTWSCYLDGQLQSGSGTMTGFSYSGTPTLYIGRWNDNYNNPFTGYINNLRVVKGSALIPTTNNADLTAVTNTQLLTLQDATIVDNSTNGFTVTENGSVTTSTESIATSAINEDGTITSTVRANTASGFSVVAYTGTGTNGATIGHGLGSAPDMIIVKNRDVSSTSNWSVYHSGVDATAPEDYALLLNSTTAAVNTNLQWNDTAPTASVFTVGTENDVNNSGSNHIAYCFHSVSGFSKFGSYTGTGSSGNTVNLGFRPAFVLVKGANEVNNWLMYDNTRSSDNLADNRLNANLSNAEDTVDFCDFTDTGFVTNGTVHNNSSQPYIYMAFADTRDYQWNFDASGNKNNWTPNNINSNASSETTYDLMSDVPFPVDEDTSNFATFNSLNPSSVYGANTFSEGNLVTTSTTTTSYNDANIAVTSGKWYVEVTPRANWTSSRDNYVGFVNILYSSNGDTYNGSTQSGAGTFATYTNGDTIGVAYDHDAYTCEFFKNGTSVGTVTGVASKSGRFRVRQVIAGMSTAVNFGQRPFKYTPPTGYKKLNTFNLPDSSITDGSDYFDTVLYTGNGTNNSITGLEFSPDFVWMKARSSAYSHNLQDSVRGNKRLFSDSTSAELGGCITSYNSDGISFTGTQNTNNANGTSYVSWMWRGSDSTAVSNTDGTITSTVSANTTSGFSIVTYTGTGANATVGHGLGVAPSFIIVKLYNTIGAWKIYHSSLGATQAIEFTTGASATNSVYWNNTAPTNFVFTAGTAGSINSSGNNHVAYCFAEVEGFSKFGSYTGNGSADGSFVYTGFKPAFVMVKNTGSTSAGAHWFMFDNQRNVYNLTNNELIANASTAENAADPNAYLDLLSNGFKLRSNTYTNISGVNHIYMAFAENPFKNSLAR